MGEILKDFTKFSETLEHFILAFSRKVSPANTAFDSTILRWNSKAHRGDFSVAAAVVDRLKIKDVISSFSDALLKECNDWPLPVSSCTVTDQGALSFKVHRPSVYRRVLTSALEEGDHYGRSAAGMHEARVGIVSGHPLERGRKGADEDLTLSQLRGLLLTEHLSSLLEAAGFQVSHLMLAASTSSTLLDYFGIRAPQTPEDGASSLRQPKQTTLERLSQAASFKIRTSGSRPVTGPGESVNFRQLSSDSVVRGQVSQSCSDVYCDLHQFILDERLPLGKNGYDKNLQKVRVLLADGLPSSLLTQCCLIEEGVNDMHPLPSHLIHVANQAMSFQQQQLDLMWRLCTSQAVPQSHLTHGPATARRAASKKKEDVGALELLRIREAQTREASILKYGDEVQGEGWEQLIKRLTIAGLKFEILGKQCRHELKLELSNARNSSTWPDCRDGVFVMYNYARLCTLFSHFEKEVAKGMYPPLPNISSMDFSLLREDQEWGLLFNYVLQYPVTLAECVHDILEGKGPHINIQTHRMCSFLVSLCRDLSSYYSHTHVLGEARPHLVPTMFARLHLLKGVQQILTNGLSLLNVQPLTQM